MNSFRYGSRILKETATLVRSGLARHVYIAGIHEEGQQRTDTANSRGGASASSGAEVT